MPEATTRRNIADLKDGEQVDEIYQLADKQLRPNRNGDLYLLSQLRDRTGLISGLMWNITDPLSQALTLGTFVRVKGKVQQYQQFLQVIIQSMTIVASDQVDQDDFSSTPSVDVNKLLSKLTGYLTGLTNPALKEIGQAFLNDTEMMDLFCKTPAGVKAHHAYQGGLLEHVVNLMDAGYRIADLYPKLNRDLLMLGIFLHDLGKVRELTCEAIYAYSDEGQLLGHLIIAIEMLSDKVREIELIKPESIPQETVLRLKHMILSHHGTYEYGSPKLPMTIEAMILHHLDNIDAKYNEFQQLMETDPNRDSAWTQYHQRLDRKLFKGHVD
jgi:3'-5' exoribonuclease